MFGDLAEQPMFDGVVFGGAGGVVGDGDLQVEPIGENMLQEILPGAGPTAVAAAGIGEDDNLGGIGVAQAALAVPPLCDALDRKLRGVV